MNTSLASKSVLLMLLAIITFVFLSMIKAFLMAVLLAGIFSSLTPPLYQRLLSRFGGRAPVRRTC
jgi:predicted PurR-regulated permease PerM